MVPNHMLMELLQKPSQTANGFLNHQPDIAEKAERFTVLVGYWE
jgi:hypothetical protein